MGSVGTNQQDDAKAHVDACYLLHSVLSRPDTESETRMEKLENQGELQDLNVLDILDEPLTRVKRSPSPRKKGNKKKNRNKNKRTRRMRNRRMRRRRNRNRKRMRRN